MRRLAAALGALAIVAAVVVLSGVISVKASSGHLPATAWFLDFVKVRSVSTRALGITEPPLDDPGLLRLGANHFERGCRSCHGTRWQGAPLVPSRMTPPPPNLADQVGRWRARELFYLVAHGVKLSGMPAWPSAVRTDEAWALVAFLRALPTLDPAQYHAITSVDARAPPTIAGCVGCHRADVPHAPRLVGQSTAYLRATLDAYADGRRFSGIMQPVAAAIAPSRRDALAAAFGSSSASSVAPRPPATAGIVFDGDPARDVPACASCHGPGPQPRDPRFPSLVGQPATYLRLQLRLFAEGRRGGTELSEIMRPIAARLTETQVREAAVTYAALSGPPS